MDGRDASSAVDDEEDETPIMIKMDIGEPLDSLKSLLEENVPGIADHTFTLQDGPDLDGSKSLVEHGVEGEGDVVVKLELRDDERGKRLDIVDVLKPNDEDFTEPVTTDDPPKNESVSIPGSPTAGSEGSPSTKPTTDVDARSRTSPPKTRTSTECDDAQDTKTALQYLQPEIFSCDGIKIEGACSLPKTEQKSNSSDQFSGSQIQLWQFLLELLTDYNHLNTIHWVGNDGEFLILDPEKVAHLWGLRKRKPQMTFDKLCRTLQCYYEGDMIAMVSSENHVFKFVCDLKFLIGYNTSELNAFVNETAAAAKKQSCQLLSEDTKPAVVEADCD